MQPINCVSAPEAQQSRPWLVITSMKNPIDKDKVAENPATLAYPHHIGSIAVRPEDEGKTKTRALSAMQEQTSRQLSMLQRQAALIAEEVNRLRERISISEKIYMARMSFEPFIGHVYHLYERPGGEFTLMMIAPDEWGRKAPAGLRYLGAVKLLSDHTWELLQAEQAAAGAYR